jgi:hypothetical protein
MTDPAPIYAATKVLSKKENFLPHTNPQGRANSGILIILTFT